MASRTRRRRVAVAVPMGLSRRQTLLPVPAASTDGPTKQYGPPNLRLRLRTDALAALALARLVALTLIPGRPVRVRRPRLEVLGHRTLFAPSVVSLLGRPSETFLL